MLIARSDLVEFNYFLAIARHRNFRLAGLEIGISASALSHALKNLETRLGVRLVNRTNRSVTLTAAGAEFEKNILGPFAEIGLAMDKLNSYRDTPSGRIRLNVLDDAAPLLLAPVLGEFSDLYPDIIVDIIATDRMVDIVEEGFDAGIRHGGTVPEDMIAQRISADLRWVVAASPAYLARFGRPVHPDDLQRHRCLGIKLGDNSVYRWQFMGPDDEFELSVPCQITISEGRAMLALALSDVGLIYTSTAHIAPYVTTGQLEILLEDWATTSPGYHLYYPGRRQLPTGLRLLLDLLRERRPLGR
jgi:DNA-binding transcriptional LysR family regulator